MEARPKIMILDDDEVFAALLSSIPVLVVTATDFSAELKRFPQVRGMFSKTGTAQTVLDALRQVVPLI